MTASAIGRDQRRRIRAAWSALGIEPRLIDARGLPLFAQASRLAPAGLGTDGRDKMLAPAAAKAWQAMVRSAKTDGVDLLLVSAFRSVEFQAELIRGKLQRGLGIEEILKVNAPPGCSEHHTGRAVDVGAPDCPPLDEAFENTAAFGWLRRRAQDFGLAMSYPRDNAQGYRYEPWHWCFHQAPPL